MADTTATTKKPTTTRKPDAAKVTANAAPKTPALEALTETSPKQRLLLKLVAASKMIKAVEKDGNNGFQHYQFQSEGAIKAAIKPSLEANGVMIIPRYEVTGQRVAGKNWVVDVLGHFTITDGVSSIIGTMAASGSDTLEKATVKAETTAQKYFYKQLFNISDNETDPDAGDSTPTAPVQQVSEDLIRSFKVALVDVAAKQGSNDREVARTVFAAAGVNAKPYSALTQEEFNRLDQALRKQQA